MKVHIRIVKIGLFGASLATLAIAQSSSTPKSAQAPSPPSIQNPVDALSRTGENHKLLATLVGTWSFTGKHSDPNSPYPEFKGTVVRHGIWEGRYFITETTGGKIAMPWADGREVAYQDMMMDGYDNEKKKFVRAMIDNHYDAGILLLEGTYDPSTKSFTYLGEAPGSPPGKKNTIHMLVTILDQDHYREEFSVKGDDGWESGVTVDNYTRLKQN